jgi:predicted membrane channel-forming protein YqfA (hemolysin III family)
MIYKYANAVSHAVGCLVTFFAASFRYNRTKQAKQNSTFGGVQLVFPFIVCSLVSHLRIYHQIQSRSNLPSCRFSKSFIDDDQF